MPIDDFVGDALASLPWLRTALTGVCLVGAAVSAGLLVWAAWKEWKGQR